MRVLLDEQLPIDLASQLWGHAVETVVGRGWAGVKNGELLNRMGGHYDVLITMDRNIEFQQQISMLPFGIVLVRARSNRMQHLSALIPAIVAAIATTKPGRVRRIGA
jgi:predicted nuclease of predicted toxin-antitoxin system